MSLSNKGAQHTYFLTPLPGDGCPHRWGLEPLSLHEAMTSLGHESDGPRCREKLETTRPSTRDPLAAASTLEKVCAPVLSCVVVRTCVEELSSQLAC